MATTRPSAVSTSASEIPIDTAPIPAEPLAPVADRLKKLAASVNRSIAALKELSQYFDSHTFLPGARERLKVMFETTDGYITVGTISDSEWNGFCDAAEQPALKDDKRFNTVAYPSITTASLPTARKAKAYSVAIAHYGGPPPLVWKV